MIFNRSQLIEDKAPRGAGRGTGTVPSLRVFLCIFAHLTVFFRIIVKSSVFFSINAFLEYFFNGEVAPGKNETKMGKKREFSRDD